MNSVYYIFIIVIILSFITGIIITIIDHIKGEPIENVEPKKTTHPVSTPITPTPMPVRSYPVYSHYSQATPTQPQQAYYPYSQTTQSVQYSQPAVGYNQTQMNYNASNQYGTTYQSQYGMMNSTNYYNNVNANNNTSYQNYTQPVATPTSQTAYTQQSVSPVTVQTTPTTPIQAVAPISEVTPIPEIVSNNYNNSSANLYSVVEPFIKPIEPVASDHQIQIDTAGVVNSQQGIFSVQPLKPISGMDDDSI